MATPNLGYGNRAEVSIDAYNRWQRSQPWYQDLIRSFGQDPNNVHLSDSQKQAVVRAAQANGVVVDEGGNGQEVDESGNFRATGHKLRNTLIVGGIAGAALLTAGLAGAFGSAAAAGGEGAAAAGGSAAGAGSAAAGAGTLAGIEGGAAGLGDAALAGLGTGAMGAAPGLGAAGAGAWDAAGNFIGDSTFGSTAAGGGTLSRILDSAGQIGQALGANEAGRASGRIAESGIDSGWNRDQLGLYNSGIAANNAENNWNLNAADTDLAQRKFALAAPGERASNSVRGDILSSARDVAFSGLPNDIPSIQISGGLRPSMFSDSTRQLGSLMSKDALAGQQKGDTFAPLTYKPGPTAPTLTPPTNSGTLDSVLNSAGLIGNLAEAGKGIWPWLTKNKGL